MDATEGGYFVEEFVFVVAFAAEEAGEPVAGAGFSGGFFSSGIAGVGVDGLAFGTDVGACVLPAAPAVVECGELHGAELEPFPRGTEAEVGAEVEAEGGKDGGEQKSAAEVEVADEDVCDEAADYALNGESVTPVPVPGEHGEDGGEEGEGEDDAGPAQPCGAVDVEADPSPAESADPERKGKGGNTEELEEEVGEVCAGGTDPVLGGGGAGEPGGGVKGGVGGVVADQSEEEEERAQQKDRAQEDVDGAGAGRRWDESDGLHGSWDGAQEGAGQPSLSGAGR